jgi:phosphoribosylanthranilate isomerase
MAVAVKICGVNSAAAIDAAAAAGADWVGFVFFPASPRFVAPETAARLAARQANGPRCVGLFVDPDDAAVATALAAMPLDAMQLYATPERAAALRRRFGVPVWRAIAVASAADLPASAEGADVLLLEGAPPAGADRPGGNARRFDWALLRGWAAPRPWVLAGGLDPANVAAAIRASGAACVDVSSGVERAPGQKDPALIRAFVAAARAA